MRLLPSPCDGQAVLKIGVLSRPVQLEPDLSRVTVDLRVITRPARQEVDLDVRTSCLLTSLHELLHRSTCSGRIQAELSTHFSKLLNGQNFKVHFTLACTNIVYSYFLGLGFLESLHMCINKIRHIDVIPNTSAVWCAIVCPFNLKNEVEISTHFLENKSSWFLVIL